MYACSSASLAGLEVIRSHKAESEWLARFEHNQDAHSRAVFVWVALGRWLSVRIDCIVYVFSVATIFGAAAARDSLPTYAVGLSIVYVLQLTGHFQWCIRQSAEVENHLTSCERILEYADLEPETAYVQAAGAAPADGDGVAAHGDDFPESWPGAGPIEFEGVSLRYAPLTLPTLHCPMGESPTLCA